MNMQGRWILPIRGYSRYREFMKTIDTALGFDRSEIAKFRLRCIQLLDKHGYEGVVLAFPQVSRRSVFRWKHAYLSSEKNLLSLVPSSTKPHIVNQMRVPADILGFLKAMRQHHPHLSKYKLKPFLDVWCQQQGLALHSTSWIGKVLTKYHLFFGERKRIYRRRTHSRSGYTIRRTPNPAHTKLGYLQLDGIKVYWSGKKVLFLTALELKTRTAWVKIVPSLTSHHAKLFLEEILSSVSYPFHTIHTDNGGEFKAVFDQALVDLKLLHLWSPPRSPKIHAHMERFNGVFQDEFVDYHIDEAVTDRAAFQGHLTNWLEWYNTKRPHHSLNLLSPQQFLLHLSQGAASSAKCP